MRVCCVTTVIAALALRSAAEPTRRYPAEWRADLALRSRPLHELFDETTATDPERNYAQPMHNKRRTRTNKRAPRLPGEVASQMMLRAARSGRPYDVPQIGEFLPVYIYFRNNGHFYKNFSSRTKRHI
ncbi:unnamed protein product [Leptosia nina]|uniref:Secreted protein n=1 Tax=Leptosia nina TaxID=320188 RepID=A0AAV1K3C2_9NEOP